MTKQYRLSLGNGMAHSVDKPPTSLQYKIADLLAFVRGSEASAADFMAAIDRTLAAARSLEEQRNYYRDELESLRQSLALAAPKFNLDARIDSVALTPMSVASFRVRTDLPEWRIAMSDQEWGAVRDGSSRAGKVLRWRTYLAFAREIRRRLEQGFAEVALR